MFFLIGASCAVYAADVHVGLLFAVLIGCTLARGIALGALSVPLNWCARQRAAKRTKRQAAREEAAAAAGSIVGPGVAEHILVKKELIALWAGGLRGAIAFALVLSFPSAHRATLIGTTAWVVLITTVVGGGAAPFMLRRLGVVGGYGLGQGRRDAGYHGDGSSLADFHVQLDAGTEYSTGDGDGGGR
eukprot:COSAG05_NODE_259_length_12737_cov_42.436145_6_plen_188_part_00